MSVPTDQLLNALLDDLAERVAEKLAGRAPAAPAASADPAAFLSEKAAAQLLGFSPRTLETWRREGTGPQWRRIGRAIRYARGDLVAFDVATHRPRQRGATQ